MTAYWDFEHCGPERDNHNWEWCGEYAFNCAPSVDVLPEVCSTRRANLVFSEAFVQVGECGYAYYAQYACVTTTSTLPPSTTPPTTSVATTTAAPTTTVLDDRLAAYWDHEHCGPTGDNANWEWCDGINYRCRQEVEVSQDLCESRSAHLVSSGPSCAWATVPMRTMPSTHATREQTAALSIQPMSYESDVLINRLFFSSCSFVLQECIFALSPV